MKYSKKNIPYLIILSFISFVGCTAITFKSEKKNDYYAIEDKATRNSLPLYKTILAEKNPTLSKIDLVNNKKQFKNWHRSHGGDSSTKYSSLSKINSKNVKKLKVSWIYTSKGRKKNIQCNPIIAEETVFFPTPNKTIVAVNAESGKELWQSEKFNFPARRGLTYWPGTKSHISRLYVPTEDGIYALNPKTGKKIIIFGNNGHINAGIIHTPPFISKNILTFATRRSGVVGVNVITGKELWRFNIINIDQKTKDEFHKKSKRKYRYTGSAPWGGMSGDTERGIVYLSTGNPRQIFVGIDRPGRNKHSVSIIAIDIKTGKKIWDFQEIKHDLWDLDIPAPPILTSITRNNKKIDVVLGLTKYGNTLVLDRLTGKPIFDYRLKRALTSNLPGEKTWPYQPALITPEPLSKQIYSSEDITNIGSKNKDSVLKQLKNSRYGFFLPPSTEHQTIYYGPHGGSEWPGGAVDPVSEVLYVGVNDIPWKVKIKKNMPKLQKIDHSNLLNTPGHKAFLKNCFTCHNSKTNTKNNSDLIRITENWSKNELVHIMYNGLKSMQGASDINKLDTDRIYTYLKARDHNISKAINSSDDDPKNTKMSYHYFRRFQDFEGYPASKPPWGKLVALSLKTGKIKWQVPLGEHKELTARGIPITGTENFSGPLVTAGGLVFASGTKDSKIRAFNKNTGEELWSFTLPFIGSAPPSTYEINGKQYILIPATGSRHFKDKKGSSYISFSLP